MKNHVPIQFFTVITSLYHIISLTQVSAVNFIDTNSSVITPSQGMLFASTSGLNPSTVSSAGDLNADGHEDLLIGVSSAGSAYVIFGTAHGIPQCDLTTMTETLGIKISVTTTNSYLGYSVDHLGDVNGDGIDDIVIGAYGASAAYIIFGQNGTLTDIDVSFLDASKGIKITGVTNTRFGIAVSGIGDINDDGINDIMIGAPYGSSSSGVRTGVAYVIFGNNNGLSDINVNSLRPEQGFKVFGTAANQQFGVALSPAGDVNKDGVNDFMVGAPSATSLTGTAGAGRVYVFYGRKDEVSDIDASSMNADQGFTIYGFQSSKPIGTKNSISSIGDINGDGASDLIIGQPDYFASGTTYLGKAYVIYGQEGGVSSAIQVNTLTAAQGFTITGASVGDKIGYSVAAGDINNDGIPDLMVDSLQATTPSGTSAGKIFVFFGHEGGFDNIYIGNATSEHPQTLEYYGADGSALGSVIKIAKDVNGDGVNDILAISASFSGIYILYGSDCDSEASCSSDSLNPVCYASKGCVCGEYNKFFQGKECVAQCLEGYYPEDSLCKICPDSCSSCTGPSTCQSCQDLFLLQETSCVSDCSTGYHKDGTNCILDQTGNNSSSGGGTSGGNNSGGSSGEGTSGGNNNGGGSSGGGTSGGNNSGGSTSGNGTSGGGTSEGNGSGSSSGAGGNATFETVSAKTSNMGLIIGVIVGVIVLLIGAIIAFFFRKQIMAKLFKATKRTKYTGSAPKQTLRGPNFTEGEGFIRLGTMQEPHSPLSPLSPNSPFGSPHGQNSRLFPQSTQTLTLFKIEVDP